MISLEDFIIGLRWFVLPDTDGDILQADTMNGFYRIEKVTLFEDYGGGYGWRVWSSVLGSSFPELYPSVESAQTAIKEDYESRILSAIDLEALNGYIVNLLAQGISA